jgi:hypothetical protein
MRITAIPTISTGANDGIPRFFAQLPGFRPAGRYGKCRAVAPTSQVKKKAAPKDGYEVLGEDA